jgi:hypothetical protein
MKTMGRNGVSSDESDPDEGSSALSPSAFRIISPIWRSAEMATFLRGLDKGVLERKLPLAGHRKRRGQPTRRRKLPEPEYFNEQAIAPLDLPRNCYDDAWYEKLPGWAKRKIAPQSDYDFVGLDSEAEKNGA